MNNLFEKRIKIVISSMVTIAFLIFGIGCIYVALSNINLINVQVAQINENSIFKITDVEMQQIQQSTKDVPVIYETEQVREEQYQNEIIYASINETEEVKKEPYQNEVVYLLAPVKGDVIGSLWIPSLELVLPIIEGTDSENLAKGVGHFIESVLPGEEDNCVLSGHRDTVFMNLGSIKIGDKIIIKTITGLFIYQVSNTRIVDKDDKTVIVPTDTAVLTLTTCYPFVFIGASPERFIVTADLLVND